MGAAAFPRELKHITRYAVCFLLGREDRTGTRTSKNNSIENE